MTLYKNAPQTIYFYLIIGCTRYKGMSKVDTKQREEYKKIGARIREIRLQKHMSQANLADKANIHLSHISDIENGKSTLLLPTFIRITEALQVSADVLLRSDIPEVNNLYKSEFAEILEDCTPLEIDSIINIVKEVKRSMHSPKNNKDF